uniref:Uncharacterized protein LOC113786990 n=1 Tax=Cicer arietinum TaxID=3827 RepID=A0A3Q7XT44_CICAR|nr:uncharacterized protein LOC113786990 [Cicer arietinum]
MICLYVDDLLVTSCDETEINQFKVRMKEDFEMTDLRILFYFLGIEFVTIRNGILMHPKKYATDVLKRFNMQDCNDIITPSKVGMILSKEGNKELVDSTNFKQMVGSLRYLCNTRSDITYSVGLISKYMEKLRAPHYLATKKILRYIKETSEFGLLYPRSSNESEAELIGYIDFDW